MRKDARAQRVGRERVERVRRGKRGIREPGHDAIDGGNQLVAIASQRLAGIGATCARTITGDSVQAVAREDQAVTERQQRDP